MLKDFWVIFIVSFVIIFLCAIIASAHFLLAFAAASAVAVATTFLAGIAALIDWLFNKEEF